MSMPLKDLRALFGHQLELMFLQTAKAEAQKRLDMALPHGFLEKVAAAIGKIDEEKIARIEKVAEAINALPNLNGAGLLTKEEHRKILKCLHPDSKPTAKQRAEAFAIFQNANPIGTHEKPALAPPKDGTRRAKGKGKAKAPEGKRRNMEEEIPF
jgi:hypothetical protein